MRELLKSDKILERKARGELIEIVDRQKHADPNKCGQPFCTYSQIVSFLDVENNEIARFHQYKKPDSAIGGSGLPDPVRIESGGKIYKLKRMID